MRKTIISTGLLLGLLSLGLSLPSKAQWANRGDCDSLNFLHQKGYCIDHDFPMVATWSWEGDSIIVTEIPLGGYHVAIDDYSDERDSRRLRMSLDENRGIERITQGSQAVAENHRAAISHALDILEDWEPLSDSSF